MPLKLERKVETVIDVDSAVYALSPTQRRILRILIHRAEPLTTSAIRLILASYIWKIFAEKHEVGEKAIRPKNYLWSVPTFEQAIGYLRVLKKLDLRREVPSYKGLQTMLESLHDQGFIQKAPGKGKREKAFWVLDIMFARQYLKRREEIAKGPKNAQPEPVREFYEVE